MMIAAISIPRSLHELHDFRFAFLLALDHVGFALRLAEREVDGRESRGAAR